MNTPTVPTFTSRRGTKYTVPFWPFCDVRPVSVSFHTVSIENFDYT